MNHLRATLLSVVPALVMAVGIALAGLSGGSDFIARREVSAVFAAATLAPVIAIAVLNVLAPGFDLILVSASAMIASIGTSSLLILASTIGTDRAFYSTIALRHGLFVSVGFVSLIAGALFARRADVVRRYPFALMSFALLLTVVTILFGEVVNGARLWLQLGPVQFQPSEVARLLLAGFIASYLYDRRHLVAAPWRSFGIDLPPAPYLIPLAFAVLSAVTVLVFQNDLGMAALVVLAAFATVAGILESKSSLGVASAFLAISAVLSFIASPRVRDRVAGWLDPWRDPAGRGFQFVQADYSLAAGGINGFHSAIPALSVPEIHTDFALVGVSSLFGWLGGVAVFVLTGILLCRCAFAALRARNSFRSLLALSACALIGLQVILIAGGTLRVLPLTGLTFPFLSYGGTSMVATMFAVGLVVGLGEADTSDIYTPIGPGH